MCRKKYEVFSSTLLAMPKGTWHNGEDISNTSTKKSKKMQLDSLYRIGSAMNLRIRIVISEDDIEIKKSKVRKLNMKSSAASVLSTWIRTTG